MKNLTLYHTSKIEIKDPDIKHGRINADFGQGFYTSPDLEFSQKWADSSSVINVYELSLKGLNIKEFNQSIEWYEYIYNNRNGGSDYLSEYDLIIGPISNDTLYDTWGVLTSGLIDKDKSFKALCVGNIYTQVVLKSEKAKENLKFIEVKNVYKLEIDKYKKILKKEEAKFQDEFMKVLAKELDGIIN